MSGDATIVTQQVISRGSATTFPSSSTIRTIRTTTTTTSAAAPPPAPTDADQSQSNTLPISNCSEARALGIAPLIKGEDAQYAPRLDRDGDGIACEPLPEFLTEPATTAP